jgi:hypothetical protein
MLPGLAGIVAMGMLAACGSVPPGDPSGPVYHCVDRSFSFAPDRKRITHLDLFEYGAYRIEDRPTMSAGGICITMLVPKSAHVRYWLGDQLVDKRVDLPMLDAAMVRNKSVEFYFDDDMVEVRLMTLVPGQPAIRKVLLRQ